LVSKMFPFITATWNPLGGECLHKCSYCWARKLAERYQHKKYQGKPRLITHELERKFTEKDFVFVCDMTDLFGHWVPAEIIEAILEYIHKSPATFLLLTKNPWRYREFKIPVNCVCGATIESDIDHELTGPPEAHRILAMVMLKNVRKMVSIEPVMEFTPDFQQDICNIYPEFVAIGYDNYCNHLDEPELEDVEALIHGFENRGIRVYRKSLQEAWNHAEVRSK
jgi:DNA repair photolyase